MRESHQTNFEAWFADSKVVDAAGKPLVVYHGTTSTEIHAFHDNKATEKDSGWYGRGIYFTADPASASAYSGCEETEEDLLGSPHVMPVFVSLKNPYVWPADRRAALTPQESNAIRQELEEVGYDGIIVPNVFAEEAFASHYEVVAFRPTQVKSAIGNSGLYAQDNPDITDRRIAAAQDAFDYLASVVKKAVPHAT